MAVVQVKAELKWPRATTMNQKRNNPKYGRGTYEIGPDDWYEPEQCARALRAVLTGPNYQPPVLPGVALELMALANNPEVSFQKVRQLIEAEPLLAAKVLRTAQSALYARGATIASLDDAMNRLGLRTLTDLFMQAAVTTRVFRAKGYEQPMAALQKHSVVCAHTSRAICRRTSLPDEYAFMCGLLHDVGLAAGMLVLADVPRGQKVPDYSLVAPALVAVHCEVAQVLAQAWDLPADVQLLLAHHHQFQVDSRPHPLAAAVCLADWIASEAGAPAGDEATSNHARQASQYFGLSHQEVQALQSAAELVVDEL